MSVLPSLNSPYLTPQPEPPGPSVFDYLTKLIVPVIALVALILTRSPKQTALTWGLLAVAAISFLAAFYPQLVRWVGLRWLRRRDRRTAKQAFPTLKTYVERFGQFVSQQRGDTIHYIIQSEVCGNKSDIFSRFNLPHPNIFQGFWADLQMVAEGSDPTLANFEAAALQLGTLVALFNNHCMDIVFGRLPQDLRSQITDNSKSSLNACRERFNAFLEQYESFLVSLDRSFAERHVPVRSFLRVKPL